MRAQYLDKMDLERERGITIKAQSVRLLHEGFELNLIDTPGHVDFTYEVSRSLEACEGAVLLVDAAQGLEAQTLANYHLARDAGLVIVPAINKIDLPAAEPEQRTKELAHLLDCDPDDILHISAKSGEGVDALLAAVIERVPPPGGRCDEAAAGADLRLAVRPLPRRDHVPARAGRRAALGRAHPHVRDPRRERGRGDGRERARADAGARPRSRRGRLPRHRPEGRAPREGRRHDHARRQAGRDRAAARLPRAEAHGVVGAVPGRRQRLRRPARRPRQAEAQRRGPALRARDLAGARVRVPVRVPRPAAHGHREGAPRARVRPGAHRDGAERGVPRVPRHRDDDRAQPGRDAAGRRLRPGRGARRVRHGHHAVGLPRRGDGPVPGTPRRAGRHELPHARARRGALRAADGRDRVRLLRPAEVGHPRLREPRLRALGPAGSRPRARRRAAARRARRRVQHDRAPRRRRTPTARRWSSGSRS